MYKHNISQIDMGLRYRDNCIDVVINRAPKNPKLADLDRRISQIEELGLSWNAIDDRLASYVSSLSLVDRATLMDLLEGYMKKDEQGEIDLSDYLTKAEAEARYLRKQKISESGYNELESKEENVLYIIE